MHAFITASMTLAVIDAVMA